MARRRSIHTAAVAIVAAVVLSACGADWAQWGNGPAHTSDQASERTITAANVGTLFDEWGDGGGNLEESVTTPAVVAAALAQPDGQHTDVVFVGTQIGNLYAVRHDGSVLWSRNLGFAPTRSDCEFQPRGEALGVRGSPVYDRATNRIYSTGGDGRLFALDAATGAIVSGWPIRLIIDPSDEYFGAAPLFVGGFLYVPIGNPCGTGPGRERIVRVDVATLATLTWYVDGGGPTGESGGFGLPLGGPAADPHGNVYVGTGQTDFVDAPEARSLVKLSPSLQVLASYRPPAGALKDGSQTFGGPIVFGTSQCPNLVASEHQDGTLMLFDRDAIGNGPLQSIKVSTGFASFGSGFSGINNFVGTPAWSPRTGLLYVGITGETGPNPTFRRGIAAFALDASCRLVRRWNTVGPGENDDGFPTVANDVVFSVGSDPYALDATTGRLLDVLRDATGPSLGKAVVANGRMYLGDVSGNSSHLHSFGVDNTP